MQTTAYVPQMTDLADHRAFDGLRALLLRHHVTTLAFEIGGAAPRRVARIVLTIDGRPVTWRERYNLDLRRTDHRAQHAIQELLGDPTGPINTAIADGQIPGHAVVVTPAGVTSGDRQITNLRAFRPEAFGVTTARRPRT
jgi:hypothetical protein